MLGKLLNEKMSKIAMIQANEELPVLEVHCYDSKGDFKRTMVFQYFNVNLAKTDKLFKEVKGCKEETKFDAWLGKKPGAGKEIKFEGKGLTGKSSIFKLYCAAFGGASKLEKLLNEQEKNVNDIKRDYFDDKITYEECNDRITKVLIETTTMCIQVVE